VTSSAVLAAAGALVPRVVLWTSVSRHLSDKLLATSGSSKFTL